MKIYLDFQIWDYINKNTEIKEYFKNKEEWYYLISVAHLEELYRAERLEQGNKVGLTNELKNTMKEMAMDGVIKPTEGGIKYKVKSYEKTYQDITEKDTQESVLKRSLFRRDKDKNDYDPKDLFMGIKHDRKDEYKLVWETPRVKDEICKLRNNNSQLIVELSNPDNLLRKDMEKVYGKNVTDYMMCQLKRSSRTEIKPAIYSQIRDDYHVLEYVIEQLYIILTKCGFRRDNSDKHANSGTYDIQHSICATLCDIFITNDNRFADKFKAIAYYLAIPIEIKRWDDDVVPQINLSNQK